MDCYQLHTSAQGSRQIVTECKMFLLINNLNVDYFSALYKLKRMEMGTFLKTKLIKIKCHNFNLHFCINKLNITIVSKVKAISGEKYFRLLLERARK